MKVIITIRFRGEVIRICEREINLFTQHQMLGRTINREVVGAANDRDANVDDMVATLEFMQ